MDPVHPPTNIRKKRKRAGNVPQFPQSADENPVVVMIEITLKAAKRIAFAKS